MYYNSVLDLIGNTPLISLEETTGLREEASRTGLPLT